MKAWRVCDSECCIFVRSATRGKARTFWPGEDAWDFYSPVRVDVWREPDFDGDGPARELERVDVPCKCENFDGDCPDCFEGFRLDRDATVRANR